MGMGDDYSEFLRQERAKQEERDRQARAYSEETARRAEESYQQSRREDMDRDARRDARSGHYNHNFSGDAYYESKRKSAEFWDWDSRPNREARESSAFRARKTASHSGSGFGATTARSSASSGRGNSKAASSHPDPISAGRIARRGIVFLLLIAALSLAGWIGFQLYDDHRRTVAEETFNDRMIRAAHLALTDPALNAAVSDISGESQQFTAAVQYNLKHMPVDKGQSLRRGDLSWKYWGPVDGEWSSMDGAISKLCTDQLKSKLGALEGLTLSPQLACADIPTSNPPVHIERLTVYTTELRHALTKLYCTSGPTRWQNCPVSKHPRKSRRR